MDRKRFAVVTIVAGIVALAATGGYFALHDRSANVDRSAKPATPVIPGYPNVLRPLSQTELSGLRTEFEAANKGICVQLDEFGLTVYKDNCLDYMLDKTEITDNAKTVEMAKDWIVQNSKFTGITDASSLIVKYSNTIDIGHTLLKIDFNSQTVEGLPVEGDFRPPTVFVNAHGVSRMDGHRFPNITIPPLPKITEASAKDTLIGRTFTYSDFTGQPLAYRVAETDLGGAAEEVVFIKKSSEGLEFRRAWKIPVGRELTWTVYVDAMTGEELGVIQRFQT